MRREINEDDVLRHYMNASDVSKAPEGFSTKVMSHIYLETRHSRKEKSYLIPVITAAVFLTLVISALLLPHSSLSFPDLSFPEFSGLIQISFPDLNTGNPRTLLYIFTGIIAIIILDSGLKAIFKTGKELK